MSFSPVSFSRLSVAARFSGLRGGGWSDHLDDGQSRCDNDLGHMGPKEKRRLLQALANCVHEVCGGGNDSSDESPHAGRWGGWL